MAASHQDVQAICESRDGSLWGGSRVGLYRLRPQRFFLWGAAEGIPKLGILSLCEDTEGRLWLAARDVPPLRAVDPSNRSFAALPGWPGGSVLAMCRDPSGGIWAGVDGSPLRRWQYGSYSWKGPGLRVSTLLCDGSGDVWIATIDGGLVRLPEGQELGTTEPQGQGLNRVRALAEDAAGALWAGTESGLVFRREGGRFARVPLPETKGGAPIRFLVPDGDAVWIGSRDAGLYRWRAGKVQRLRPEAGLPSDDLRALVIGPDGSFWLAFGGGLFRTSRQSLEEVLAGKQRLLRSASYGRSDGLPRVGFTFGRRNASVCTRDGHVWFATDRGPLEIDPEPLRQNAPRLPVLLEEASIGRRTIPLSKGVRIVLPPKPGPLQIRYTVPDLTAPERLRFRYRLAGLEDGWTEAQNERTATFARLPRGTTALSSP